jgi:hypothetical protein
MGKLKNWLQKIIEEVIEKEFISIPHKLHYEVIYSLFSYIGIERVKKIIEEMEKFGINYTSLAELYSLTLRDNLEADNNDRMHAYYELLPKLDEYKKAFDLENWEKRKNKRFM